jgi:signal transduction histidine kinase
VPKSPDEERLLSNPYSEGFALAVGQLGLAFGELSLDGKWVLCGQRLSALFGLSPAEIQRRSVSEVLVIDPMADADFRRLTSHQIPCFSRELKVRADAPGDLWVNCAFCLVQEDADQTPRILVVLQEITDLKKIEEERRETANRVIRAQETERTRIARELHDDIGQRLAILRMQMLRAGQPVSDVPGKSHPSIPQLSESVREIANKVSQISHQLHSDVLEYVGLRSAIRNACRDFDSEYRIRVNCICENMDVKVTGDVGLCFLRVLQEALHNIGKHSAAENVEVHLAIAQENLTLHVIDDGHGFDLEQARLASGLGLISMRERMGLAGGHFEIKSHRGKGTQIRAWVPISSTTKASPAGA